MTQSSGRPLRARARLFRRSGVSALLAGASLTGVFATARPAAAQQKTFHLDRLEVAGSPDDGIAIFRPYTRQNTIFFAQLALGYSLQPLRTSQITPDAATINRSHVGVVQDQFTSYANVGFELFDRIILGASLPITWIQDGNNPDYGSAGLFGGQATTQVSTSGPAAGDMRFDIRGVILRSDDRKEALGARLSIYAPTGTSSNFGSDGQTTTSLSINGEIQGPLTFVGETGVDFRASNSINAPTRGAGLGIGDEWRWAVSAFLPIQKNKFRIGATLFGQTGIESNDIIGNTFFTKQNTDLEWLAEGRMRFGPQNHFWAGVAGGTRILQGYGGPNLRLLANLGFYVPILDSGANSPEGRANRDRFKNGADRDGDGIPDELDACPDEPEDHLGSDPNDGCPIPADRDGDGIPDPYDKCPDVPEDKDGVEDWDGCPEDDADHDGVPDTMDACPREPGKPAADPKKNGCPQFIRMEGSTVRVLQQVHFQTGSSNILPDSFPMLQEMVSLLDANPSIQRMSIEGHTDDKGDDAMNMKLSEGRAKSVMTWLVQHGIAEDRLESHGFGETQPVADNATEEGRAQNRRVEFKIMSEDTGMHKPAPPTPEPAPTETPRNEGELDE